MLRKPSMLETLVLVLLPAVVALLFYLSYVLSPFHRGG